MTQKPYRVLVACKNGKNPYEGGDWPEKGKTYNIERVDESIIDGLQCYVISDMETGKILKPMPPYTAYHERHFGGPIMVCVN